MQSGIDGLVSRQDTVEPNQDREHLTFEGRSRSKYRLEHVHQSESDQSDPKESQRKHEKGHVRESRMLTRFHPWRSPSPR